MKDYGVELIPRQTLFGNPERTAVTLSHDGTQVAYLAPLDGVLNVWVAPLDAIGDAKPVTRDRGRGIRHYLWSYHPGYLLYGQDRDRRRELARPRRRDRYRPDRATSRRTTASRQSRTACRTGSPTRC